jgi:hypothetical protein
MPRSEYALCLICCDHDGTTEYFMANSYLSKLFRFSILRRGRCPKSYS